MSKVILRQRQNYTTFNIKEWNENKIKQRETHTNFSVYDKKCAIFIREGQTKTKEWNKRISKLMLTSKIANMSETDLCLVRH